MISRRDAYLMLFILAALACISSPTIYVLFGEKHFYSFLLGLGVGIANLVLLGILGKILLTSAEPKSRKGLIFLLILKYPLLIAVLFWGLYKMRWPPITMIAGVTFVFPPVFTCLWLKNRQGN